MNAPIMTDEMLVAYLDGELSASEEAIVRRALATDQALQARRDLMMRGAVPFKAAFASVANAAPNDLGNAITPMLNAAGESKHGNAPLRMDRRVLAAGFAAAAVLGPLGLWAGRSSRPDMTNWREAVAQYHKLYSDRTLAGIADVPSGHGAEIARVGRELGLNLSLSWLDGVTAQYRRAQVLAVDSTPLAQIVLSSVDGKALAYCIRRISETASTPQLETRAGLSVAHWNTGKFGFLIVGPIDSDQLLTMAKQLHANATRLMS